MAALCPTLPNHMLKNRKSSRGGFTLVEIMIVVAIIGLLAAIAVPGFIRARKRSQATAILNDCRVLDGALQQYATENNRVGSTASDSAMLTAYLKPGSRMYAFCAANVPIPDLVGNPYQCPTVDSTYKVNAATVALFTDVIPDTTAFWGSHAP